MAVFRKKVSRNLESRSFSRAFSNAFSGNLNMVSETRKTMFSTVLLVFVFVSVSVVDSSPAIPDNSDVLKELGVDLSNQGRILKHLFTVQESGWSKK